VAFEVIWAYQARRHVREITDYIGQDDPAAAARFARDLVLRAASLGRFPRSGAVYVHRRGFEVRQIAYRKYRIFFRVRPRLKWVEILAVRHGARREPRFSR
jgi:plasmid stabilization system protein ParE